MLTSSNQLIRLFVVLTLLAVLPACASEGVCEPRPAGCLEERAAVCGCDGHPYTNRCEAARVGVSVANEGDCSTGGIGGG